MHEAGIAASILEIVEDAARGHGDAPIRVVGLRLGALTGVVRESLEFAFDALKAGTHASGARLEIREIPLTGACSGCGWSGAPVEHYCLLCPRCQGPLTILSGRELQVEYVDLDVQQTTEGETNYGTAGARNQGPAQKRRVCRSQSPAV